jgi:hypothetical protein
MLSPRKSQLNLDFPNAHSAAFKNLFVVLGRRFRNQNSWKRVRDAARKDDAMNSWRRMGEEF